MIPETPMTCYHHYSSSWHANPTSPGLASWRFGEGDYYRDLSLLAAPLYLPTVHNRTRGAAQSAGEIGLPAPNRYQLEGTLAVAAHASMLDTDLVNWHNLHDVAMDHVVVNKFVHARPHLLQQFPGAALLYRRGDVKEAPVVVFERRSLDDISRKKLPLLANARSGDPLYRQATQTDIELPIALEGGIDPLAFFVGAVEVEVGEPSERQVHRRTSLGLQQANVPDRRAPGARGRGQSGRSRRDFTWRRDDHIGQRPRLGAGHFTGRRSPGPVAEDPHPGHCTILS
jgi:hypothetical protein